MADVYFEALPDLPGLPPEGPPQRHAEQSSLASSTPEPVASAAPDARGPERPPRRPLEDSNPKPGPNTPGILDARSGRAVPSAADLRGGWLWAHAVLEEGGVAVQLLGCAELPAELLAGRCRINIEL